MEHISNSIRNGNWINAEPYGDFKVVAMNVFSDSSTFYKSLEYYPQAANGKTIAGIPLTEEWIKRFGGRKHLEYMLVDVANHDALYLIYSKGMYHWGQGTWSVKLEFVHELQNLYYALTKKELEECIESKKD